MHNVSMFIGSINRQMRAVLEQAAGQRKGLAGSIAYSGPLRLPTGHRGIANGPVADQNVWAACWAAAMAWIVA
jgi:hypothetical protein